MLCNERLSSRFELSCKFLADYAKFRVVASKCLRSAAQEVVLQGKKRF